ncbi:MAG: DUF4832 domain-containing protein [Prevotella sp.]|nr:DUF4832 domain-containing protein [Prevotella sp.]
MQSKTSRKTRPKTKLKTAPKIDPKKLLAIAGAVLILLVALIGLVVGLNQKHQLATETTDKISNPGIGFYRTAPFSLTEDGGTEIHLYKDYNLHHLRINLRNFSKAYNHNADLELTEAALEKLEANIQKLYDNEKCAVVRFAYDNFNGLADQEPSEAMILKHIEQISPILNRYPHTITAIEVGLVGKWGEMHSSQLANPATISKLIDKFLTCTQEIPILVRTPKMIYDYLGIKLSDLDHYHIDQKSPAYRLGIFNDGYLGSSSDLGTYTKREQEIAWLSQQTTHLPYGGEAVHVDEKMIKLENCLDEMRQIHLSYLNYEWNNITTQQIWATTFATKVLKNEANHYQLTQPRSLMTVQRYLENRMGYRFLVTNRKIKVNHQKIQITMCVTNVGFGNLTKTAHGTIILQNQDNQTFYYSVTDFTGQGNYSIEFEHELATGKYKIYYCPHLDVKENHPYYTIAFANEQMYDATLKANYIGNLNI